MFTLWRFTTRLSVLTEVWGIYIIEVSMLHLSQTLPNFNWCVKMRPLLLGGFVSVESCLFLCSSIPTTNEIALQVNLIKGGKARLTKIVYFNRLSCIVCTWVCIYFNQLRWFDTELWRVQNPSVSCLLSL